MARRSEDDNIVLDLDGRSVTVSHPDNVFFGGLGATKLDLVRYYEAVRGPLLSAMGGRRVLLQRFPEGAGGPSMAHRRTGRPRTAASGAGGRACWSASF